MLCHDLKEFHAQLPTPARIAGLDVGTRTVGGALSDALRCVASPHVTLTRGQWQPLQQALHEMTQTYALAGWVVGDPRNMDSSVGSRGQSARAFARNVQQAFALPVLMWDERLSTVAAHRTLLEADLSRRRRAQVVDKLAAAYILQGVLDGMQRI